jgi:transcriptional regulator with XRE-family HTH domain
VSEIKDDPIGLFFEKFADEKIDIGEAVKEMRKISQSTQPEFSVSRKVALATLRQIESGLGDPKLSTINKLVGIFGLKVGLVKINKVARDDIKE